MAVVTTVVSAATRGEEAGDVVVGPAGATTFPGAATVAAAGGAFAVLAVLVAVDDAEVFTPLESVGLIPC